MKFNKLIMKLGGGGMEMEMTLFFRFFDVIFQYIIF